MTLDSLGEKERVSCFKSKTDEKEIKIDTEIYSIFERDLFENSMQR